MRIEIKPFTATENERIYCYLSFLAVFFPQNTSCLVLLIQFCLQTLFFLPSGVKVDDSGKGARETSEGKPRFLCGYVLMSDGAS